MFLCVFHRYSNNSSPPILLRHLHHGSMNDDRSQKCTAIKPEDSLLLGAWGPALPPLHVKPPPHSPSSARRPSRWLSLYSESRDLVNEALLCLSEAASRKGVQSLQGGGIS